MPGLAKANLVLVISKGYTIVYATKPAMAPEANLSTVVGFYKS